MSTGGGLNLATCWEAVADGVPDAMALVHGDLRRTWAEFEARSARLAGHLHAAGVGHDAKVAFYLFNGPEYLEGMFAAFKQRSVPVNVNYRYLTDELRYLLDNSDAEAVLFSAELADRLDAVRADVPAVRTFLCVGADDQHPLPDWAVDYESALRDANPAERIDRSESDLWFLYTGGTTGMPKGVMWPHRSLLGTATATFGIIDRRIPSTPAEASEVAREFHARGKAVRMLPAAPLMHGTSAITAVAALSHGGCITTLTGRSFDADELCAAVARDRISQLTIVGDAFAKPIVAALRAAADAGHPYDLSSLKVVASSGVMWSAPVKAAFGEFCSATLADLLGSSEGVGFGASVSKPGSTEPTAKFQLGKYARVFTESGDEVQPGSGVTGVLAVGGPIPIGYYKDPEKTAATFRTFAGSVWSVPGDFATVEADGTIRLLGRGSVCI
ncbi:MAG: AMP-binding protein, partial [Actinomycetes bacterium]